MSMNTNICQFTGRLACDAYFGESKKNGSPFSKITLANNRVYKNKAGEWQEAVSYIEIWAYGKIAELLKKRKPVKGEYVLVKARCHAEKDENNKIVYSFVIDRPDGLELGDRKSVTSNVVATTTPEPPNNPFGGEVSPDDDIPF